MKLSRAQFVSLVGLVAIAAGLGFAWGRASLPPSETEVINAVVARYLAETGGAPTDCFAQPGADGQAWLTVFCDGAAGRFAYPVDRQGQALDGVLGGAEERA